MIKYETVENKYLYDTKTVEQIVELIQSGQYSDERYLSQEKVSTLVETINNFLNNLKVQQHKVVKERHETEEEAREYFGEEFIKNFDSLLTYLDKQQTIVALHGTNPEICQKICETGLQYKMPSLSSTAVQQSMAYGQHDMHYDNYESLLNWTHKDYKGLVIIAVPLECYYKEGLWNKFQETGASVYGCQDYRIDPDFIAGYLDIENKKIVINPKYNRQHNYEGYKKDNELFHERKDMDNETMRQAIIEAKKSLSKFNAQRVDSTAYKKQENEIDISKIPYLIEDLTGTFNSIMMGFPDEMNEERYKYLLKELSYSLGQIRKSIPLLKTKNQIEQERLAMLESLPAVSNFNDFWGDEDIIWGDDVEPASKNTMGK